MNWLSNLFGGIGNAAQGAGQSIMGGLGNMGQGLMSMFGGNKGGQASTSTGSTGGSFGMGAGNQSQANAGGRSGGMMGSFNPGMMGAGLGIMGLGQAMNKPVKMPDFSQNPQVQQLNNWQNQASHPMDPNVATAMQNTLNIQNEQQTG